MSCHIRDYAVKLIPVPGYGIAKNRQVISKKDLFLASLLKVMNFWNNRSDTYDKK